MLHSNTENYVLKSAAFVNLPDTGMSHIISYRGLISKHKSKIFPSLDKFKCSACLMGVKPQEYLLKQCRVMLSASQYSYMQRSSTICTGQQIFWGHEFTITKQGSLASENVIQNFGMKTLIMETVWKT